MYMIKTSIRSVRKISSIFITCFFSLTSFAQTNKVDSLISVLEKHLKDKRIPGAMISIVSSDSILFQGGIGYASLETKERVTENHLFRLGSISKSFTALAVLHVLDNSEYDLNTSLKEIDNEIPYSNPWEATDPVRIKHLLEHTTGFEDFRPKAMYNRVDSIEPSAKAMMFSHESSLQVRWKPGTMKAYCNPGYIVAGHIIEQISGETYTHYIRENILKPLGMRQSGYYFKKPQILPVAKGYFYRNGQHDPAEFRSIQGGPAGGLCSNAKEMALYLSFMLSKAGHQIDSTIFTNKVFSRIENSESTLAAKAGLLGGYGLGNFSVWKNGYLFYGHDGGIDGFMSRYAYSREANLGVAVSINRMGNATEIVDIIIDHLLGVQDKIERPTQIIPEEMKSKYTGFYGFKNFKRELFSFSDKMLAGLILDFQGDTLFAKSILGKHKYTLQYAGESKFYLGKEEKPSVILLENEEGVPVLWINDSYTEMESRPKRLIFSLIIFLSMLTPFLFMTFSFIKTVIRSFKEKRIRIKYPVFWLASISYLLMIIGLSGALSNPYESGILTINTLFVCISSLALLAFTIVAIIRSINIVIKTELNWTHLLLSLSFFILTHFFWTNGFIGLRLWAY